MTDRKDDARFRLTREVFSPTRRRRATRFPEDFIAKVTEVFSEHYLNLHSCLRDGRDLEVFTEIDRALQAAEDRLFPTFIIDCLEGVNGKTVGQLMAEARRAARIRELLQDFDKIVHPDRYAV